MAFENTFAVVVATVMERWELIIAAVSSIPIHLRSG